MAFDSSVSSTIENNSLYVKRKIQKLDAPNFANSSTNLTNIQNTYYDEDDNLYIVSSSLPNYKVNTKNTERKFSGSYNSSLIQIGIHGFITGDFIRYIPGEGNNKLNIPAGYYYVGVIDDTNTLIKMLFQSIMQNK